MIMVKLSAGSIKLALKLMQSLFSLAYNYKRSVGGEEEGPLSSLPYQYSSSSPSFSSPTDSSCTAGWMHRGSYTGSPMTSGRYVKYSYPPSLPPSPPVPCSPPPPNPSSPFLPSLLSLPSYLVVDVAVPGDLAAAGVLEEEQALG